VEASVSNREGICTLAMMGGIIVGYKIAQSLGYGGLVSLIGGVLAGAGTAFVADRLFEYQKSRRR
jgi:hypothetical protein